jgi:hypothetical protein
VSCFAGSLFNLSSVSLLTLCFYVPGIIHALCVVSSYEAENRTNKIVRAIKDSDRAATMRSEREGIS